MERAHYPSTLQSLMIQRTTAVPHLPLPALPDPLASKVDTAVVSLDKVVVPVIPLKMVLPIQYSPLELEVEAMTVLTFIEAVRLMMLSPST